MATKTYGDKNQYTSNLDAQGNPTGNPGPGGSGGGGPGGTAFANGWNGTDGTNGLGGGGGGTGANQAGQGTAGVGGTGKVIVRFPSAASITVAPGTNTIENHPGGDKLATFNVTGTLTYSGGAV
jgi:hypothetical protein